MGRSGLRVGSERVWRRGGIQRGSAHLAEADGLGGEARAEGDRAGDHEEEFTRAEFGDEGEEAWEDEPADEDDDGAAAERDEAATEEVKDGRDFGGGLGECGVGFLHRPMWRWANDGEDDDGIEILDDVDAQADAGVHRADFLACGDDADEDGGGREGEGHREGEGVGGLDADGEKDGPEDEGGEGRRRRRRRGRCW